MSGRMALDVDRNGERRNVAGVAFYVNGQCRHPPPEPHRSNTEVADQPLQLFFECCIFLDPAPFSKVPEQAVARMAGG